jgi:hypothetical protein
MANIMTGAEINRTITGNTYTLEEINFIRGSELSARHLATLFNVTIENIHYVRNRANSIEKLLRSHKRIRVDSDNPLAPPKGDPDKMCGCCSCFTEWRYYPENGIYGRCAVTGEIMHRTDPCPRPGRYEAIKGYVARFKGIVAQYDYK